MNAADFPHRALPESIDRLQAMPRVLADALARCPAALHAWQPQAGQFSLVEHACHLRDLEREAFVLRARRMLGETRPALVPFDGAAIAAARDYPSQDAHAACAAFAAARSELVAVLATVRPEDLAREGSFGDRPVCFADVIAMMVEHDAGHRAEIEQLLAALPRD